MGGIALAQNSGNSIMPVFQAKNLSFCYHNSTHSVLQDVNFTIQPGEFILLCGQSGCGKTTLLRHLKHLIAPVGKMTGELLFEGEPIQTIKERRLVSDIGFVFQVPDDQIVCNRVFAEMAFGLENLGIPSDEIRRRVAEMASFFGIEHYFSQTIETLSGGQKQILNLASVMAMQPKVLILDEPTSQLDPISSSEFFAVLSRLNQELGLTIIITEHKLEEIYPLVDRVFLMEEGKFLVQDTPKVAASWIGKHQHNMRYALPTASRIYQQLDCPGEIPLTVKEGREMLGQLEVIKTIPLKKCIQPKQKPVLKVKEVCFRYEKNGSDVLHNLSLEVFPGELLSILGGNGAGKTTLLHLLCKMYRPYQGKIKLNGKDLAKLPQKEICQNHLAYLPQNPLMVFVKDTVKQDLLFLAETQKIDPKQIEQTIQAYSFFQDILPLMERNPMDLSGGELQRAAFLKILLLKPQVILLDEPTKGLDAFSKHDLSFILKELKQHGITILMVTHDIEFSAEYSDRCALLFNGEIVSTGTPKEFFSSNHFYTTAASKISKGRLEQAVTCQDVVEQCKK